MTSAAGPWGAMRDPWHSLPYGRECHFFVASNPMSRALHRLGRFAVRRRGLVLLVWLVGAAALWTGATASGGGYSEDFRIPGVESQQALDVLIERFPEAAGGSAQVVVHATDGDLDEPADVDAIAELVQRLEDLPQVATVIDPAATGLVSADRTTAMARVQYTEEPRELGIEAYDELEAAVEPTREAGLQVELGGDLPQFAETPETRRGRAARRRRGDHHPPGGVRLGDRHGAAARHRRCSASARGIGADHAGGARRRHPDRVAPILAAMIGLGVGIDYALFIVTRHRERPAAGASTVEDAAGRAIATAGQAVVFAGGTVVIAICGLALAGIPVVTTMGFAAADRRRGRW